MEDETNTPQEYRLYRDTALIEAAQNDEHFGILLEGYQKAVEIAAARPDEPVFGSVAMAAEEGVRSWIARQGYLTQEPLEEKPI